MNGIVCAGNWVLDQVKIIGTWPKKGELSNILSETSGPGGSPFNLLVDYAHLGVNFPTWGMGCIGDDSLGKLILEICAKENINIEHLNVLKNIATSYTDVMSLKDSGERTFFHCRGANAKFSPQHISLDKLKLLNPKIFHIGYLLLLDEMDKKNSAGEVVIAELLKNIQAMGIQTSVDVVTEASTRFKEVVKPCLNYIDHLIINEVEAGNISDISIRQEDGSVDIEQAKKAATLLLTEGVNETVVIHFPEGAIWAQTDTQPIYQMSLNIPVEDIIGTVGAGDAFCAGTLWGIHNGWDPKKTLTMASGIAAASLQAANTTDGIGSQDDVENLIKKYLP
ncbi:MAG: ribokinase [Planctomycetota bacterium]|nr:MAG: ribokinase [Planctomycetota bacterium]